MTHLKNDEPPVKLTGGLSRLVDLRINFKFAVEQHESTDELGISLRWISS